MELLTLILVDDEPIILKGLLETYNWTSMGFQVVGSARDGDMAMALIEEKQPDVVLTDVCMKKMDGLTLIQEVRKKGIKTSFVVESAYKDFEYAKKACQNGALSYLVKPIDEDELERTMSQVYELCTEKKYKEKNYSLWERVLVEGRDNFLNQMLGRYLDCGISEEELSELFVSLSRKEELGHYYIVAAAGIDIAQQIVNQQEYDMKQYLLETTLYKRLKEIYPVWTKKTSEGVNCYIIDIGSNTENNETVKEILTAMRLEFKTDLVSALSNHGKGLAGMRYAYQQVQQLFSVASEAGAGLLTVREQVDVPTKSQYSIDIETQILSAIRKSAEQQMKKAYEKFIYSLPTDEALARGYMHRLAVRIEVLLYDSNSVTTDIKNSFSNFYNMLGQVSLPKMVDLLYQLFRFIIEQQSQIDNLSSEDYFKDYIQDALAYIEEHLHEETLSITSVSESVFLNPVYFGRVFKKLMKISFKRYIQNRRIDRAKELLMEDRDSISDICIKVGMSNASYFTQLFKQTTGMLPSEYKRNIKL